MAQTNFTPILTYKSDTATVVPSAGNLTNSANGAELAVNTADKRLFTKDSGGNVVELGTNPSSLTLPNGTANGVVYANGSKVLTTGSALTFDGSILGVSKSDTTNPSLFTVSNPSTTGSFAAAQMALKSYNGSSVVEGLLLSSISNSWSYGTTLANSAQVYTGLANGLALVSESSTGPIRFLVGTGAPEQMRLTSTGLGIGTSSPGVKLQVSLDDPTGTIGPRITGATDPSKQLRLSYNTTGNYANIQAIQAGTAYTNLVLQQDGGNVGIGTSAPAYKLDVVGSSRIGASGASTALLIGSDAATTGGLIFADATRFISGSVANNPYLFYTNNSEKMRLDSSGNLGIGTSSPAGRVHSSTGSSGATPSGNGNQLIAESSGNAGLTIATGASSLGNIFFADSGDSADGFVQYDQSGRSMRFGTATAERMRLDSSGNLGLGTTTPDVFGRGYGGTVLGISGASQSALVVNSGTGNAFIEMGVGGTRTMSLTATSSSASIGAIGALPFIINTNGTERARIDSSGNLLVGTTSANAFGVDFKSRVVTTGTYAQNIQGTGTDTVQWIHATNTTGNNGFISFVTDAASVRGSITYNRGAGQVAYNVTSDYRAKDIIGPVTDSGALIDSVPVYMGKMKGATQERPMFIAHEVPAYAHTGVKDAVDADGNPVYQQMDASALVPVMWAEIQSLRQRLAAAGI